MATETQATRRLNVAVSTLGKDELLLLGFQGHEELSRLFSFDLDLRSTNLNITHDKLIGHKITFHVKYDDDKPRVFYGYISQFSAGDVEYSGEEGTNEFSWRTYHVRVVPWLWFLTRRSTCRIFSNKSVPDILAKVFGDAGFSDQWESKLEGNYPNREYCVQYRETDFNFVSRLMEEEGIFYYFKHEDGKPKLILGDSPSAWSKCVDVHVDEQGASQPLTEFALFSQWEHTFEFRSGSWAQADYDFKSPGRLLGNTVPTQYAVSADGIDNTKLELYDYPGAIAKHDDSDSIETGSRLTTVRMEEEETGHDVVHAACDYRSLGPGGKFTIGGKHPAADSESAKGFVVTSIQHVATEGKHYRTGSAGGSHDDYRNSFTCIPEKQKFRPARLTPKPVVHGSQTAQVVGPDGEEIHCDEYGRVKVEFFWDRAGSKDGKPVDRSCWVRVANSMAGKQWGFVAIPRIGQEVVVEFLEGDPDRPLIVGSLYNADQKLHYSLAEGGDRDKNKAKTYLVTNTSAGGNGYNELMFDDLKGQEQVFVHAQRDLDTRVLNDSKARVLHDRHEIIGSEKDGGKQGSQYEKVFKDKHLHVLGNQAEKIEGNMQLFVGGGTGGNLDLVVDKKRATLVSGDDHLHVQGNLNAKVDKTASLTVGMDQQTSVGSNSALEAGQAVHIKAGTTLILEAGVQLSLKVGGNFIDIGPAGVSIFGTMVKINSGGAAGSGPGASPTTPTDPDKAAPTDPADALDGFTGSKSTADPAQDRSW